MEKYKKMLICPGRGSLYLLLLSRNYEDREVTQNKSTFMGVMGTRARLEWIVMRIIIHKRQVSGTSRY